MSNLPDRTRPPLLEPVRALATHLTDAALATAWRSLHPMLRERFAEAPAPRPLTRLYYTTADGWQAPLYHLEARPGSPGEPVVLAHTLGLGESALRYGSGSSLAHALADAGFSVYLLEHRGDHSAVAPEPGTCFDFDAILMQDVPAALQRAVEHAGYPRAFWVGHGMGGQLGLAWAGVTGGDMLAGVTALGAPVAFEKPRTAVRAAALATSLLPAHWSLPTRAAAQLLSVQVDEEHGLFGHCAPGMSPGPRVRGALRTGADDVPAGLLAQVGLWLRRGAFVDRHDKLDYTEALRGARVPLLAIGSLGDQVCPVGHALVAADTWGHDDRTTLRLDDGFGHLDLLYADAAAAQVHAPIVDWVTQRRGQAWEHHRVRLAAEM